MSGSASSVYMSYGSIRGEAEVPGQVDRKPAAGGWMYLTSCSLSAAANYGQRYGAQAQGGGEVTPVLISKITDASSTGMFREAILGNTNQNAVITFLRTGADGPKEYMRVELQNCGIVDFAIDSGGDERGTETFAITYGRMTFISWAYDAGGSPTGRAMATIENAA